MDDQLVETMLGMQVILALERRVDPAVKPLVSVQIIWWSAAL
jgi:hypothetical protein